MPESRSNSVLGFLSDDKLDKLLTILVFELLENVGAAEASKSCAHREINNKNEWFIT